MASSMWRMNGPCRRMAGVWLLFTMVLNAQVMCQDAGTEAPDSAPDATTAALTAADDATVAPPSGGPATTSLDSGDESVDATIIPIVINNDSQDGGAEGTTAAPSGGEVEDTTMASNQAKPGKNIGDDITDDSSSSGSSSSSSSGSSVFVGILVSGLLAALAITIGYFKCKRRPEKKAVRLAEEAYPVDQENQGNTLVSVAPLNPPPETPEKPSVNGENPEAPKTQTPPPTNGHSPAKTADMEL